MSATPENKVKKMVKAVLAEFAEQIDVPSNRVVGLTLKVETLKQYWPVPSGFGASDIDCIVCYYGRYVAIETKAPGKKATERQDLTLCQTQGAGGLVFVIDGEGGCSTLRAALLLIKMSHANNS